MPRTAQDAYAEHLAAIEKSIARIKAAVQAHSEAAAGRCTWADAGDLEHVADLLEQAAQFIDGEGKT
jgi:hypothetical protein